MQSTSGNSAARLLAVCAQERASERDWERVVEALSPRIRGAVLGTLTLCRVPRDPALVEDLVQEVWCRLLADGRRALAGFRGEQDRAAAAYVRRVAAAITVDELRARWARKRRPPQRLESIDEERSPGRHAVDRAGCPERRLLARERLRELSRLCRELLGSEPGRDRIRIARLGLIEGRSSQEIVERVGGAWTIPGVDSLLFRLRRGFERRGVRVPRRPGGLSGAARAGSG